jgi:hypothetical protein
MSYHTPPLPTGTITLAADCLEGAGQVASFLYGRDDPTTRRRVYRLATELPPEQRPPFFKMGDNILRARRSRLLDWVAAKEAGGVG